MHLINVTQTDSGMKVDGRELHEFLEVGRDFTSWIKNRIEQYGLVDGSDYQLTLTKTGERQNVTRHDYELTIEMAKELCMVENNEKGRQARKYFIECERRLKHSITQLPQTLPEALRLYAAQIEETEKVRAEKERLAIISTEQEQRLKDQETPVAIYHLAIAAHNTQSMADVAKALGTGRTRLFNVLREERIIPQGKTVPYQRFIEAGYFVVRERPRTSGDTVINDPVPRVTAKGFDYIARLLQKRQGA